MIRFVCTDKKLKQGQIRSKPGICYKKGFKTGYAIAMSKNRLQPFVRIQPNRPPISPIQRQRARPSLERLINNRPNKSTTKARDFMTTLEVPENYNISTKEKKALGTEGLKRWLINSGMYS
jgi:hypothetical protein